MHSEWNSNFNESWSNLLLAIVLRGYWISLLYGGARPTSQICQIYGAGSIRSRQDRASKMQLDKAIKRKPIFYVIVKTLRIPIFQVLRYHHTIFEIHFKNGDKPNHTSIWCLKNAIRYAIKILSFPCCYTFPSFGRKIGISSLQM